MKKVHLVVIMMSISSLLVAQKSSIHFLDDPLPSLVAQAKKTKKIIFVNMTATWCKPCKEMDITTFMDKQVIEYFSNNYLSKKIFIDKDLLNPDSISLNFRNNTKSVPTYYFIDSNGKVLLRDGGFKNPKDMLELGKKVKNMKSPEHEISKMKNIYPLKLKDKEFLVEYMQLMNLIGKKDNNSLNAYLQLVPQEDYTNESVIYTIIDNETSIHGKGYQIISSDGYRLLASKVQSDLENGNISIGYDMYRTSLNIISENAKIAINTNDVALINYCVSEIGRVMQNKQKAESVANSFIELFEEKNGRIYR